MTLCKYECMILSHDVSKIMVASKNCPNAGLLLKCIICTMFAKVWFFTFDLIIPSQCPKCENLRAYFMQIQTRLVLTLL